MYTVSGVGGPTHLKNIVIKEHHDDAGYVEGGEAGVDDEVAVVEQARVCHTIGGVVEAQHDGRSYGRRNHPHQGYRQPDPPRVLVLGVLDGLCHSYVPEIKDIINDMVVEVINYEYHVGY